MTQRQITSVMVTEGRLVAYDGSEKVKEFGQNFVAAATASPEKVITVNKYGHVEEWKFDPKFPSLDKVRMWGTSDNAVSISASGNNCNVTRSNGQTDMYVNGQKSRTLGTANTPKTSSEPSSKEDYQPEQSYQQSDTSADIPDGFMAGMGHRCKVLITEPTPGPWAKIVVWVAAISSAVAAGVILYNTGEVDPSLIVSALGLVAVNVGLSYWLRHVIAKVLVRSWYGAPLVIVGTLIGQTYPDIGGIIIAAGAIAWLWPIWPIALIVVCVVFVVMAAAGKSVPTMDRR